jgi:hypothetical protein
MVKMYVIVSRKSFFDLIYNVLVFKPASSAELTLWIVLLFKQSFVASVMVKIAVYNTFYIFTYPSTHFVGGWVDPEPM